MSDFLDLQGAKDLNVDAIHISAVANSVDPVTGAAIDAHVNRVGGTDYTFKGLWGALGPVVMPWTSVTGGTLTQPNQAFLHPANGNYYSWAGAYPVGGYVVAPGTDPALPGSGYVPRTDVVLREQLPYVIYSANGTADAAGVLAASVAAIAANKMLAIDGVAKVESAITIDAPIFDTKTQIFTADSAVTITFGYTRPEWFGDDAAAFLAAINAMPAMGGVVQLMRKRYDSPYAGPFGAAYMDKQNVTIRGVKRPWFKGDHTQLLDDSGTIINGSFYVWADNARVELLGVDCGSVQRARLGLAKTQDGLVFAPPTHSTGVVKDEGQISDVVSLGVLANDFGHNILHEGYSSGLIYNVDGRCAIHNVVCKSSNVKGKVIRARGAITDNLIYKSDDYGVNEDSSAEDVVLDEFPGNTPTYGAIFQAATAGMDNNKLRGAVIKSKATNGLRIEAPGSFVNYGFQGSDITVDRSENGVSIYGGTGQVQHVSLANITIKNATVGIVEQGNCDSNRAMGVTFISCVTQIQSSATIHVDDITVNAGGASSPSLVNYSSASAKPTIGAVTQSFLTAWDNISPPALKNGWAVEPTPGNPAFDVYARDNKINMKGILTKGTLSYAFDIDSRFIPTTDQWIPLQCMPTGQTAFAVVQTDGKVYIETTSGVTHVSLATIRYLQNEQ